MASDTGQNPPKLTQLGVPPRDTNIDRMAQAPTVEYPIYACPTLAKAIIELRKRVEVLEKKLNRGK